MRQHTKYSGSGVVSREKNGNDKKKRMPSGSMSKEVGAYFERGFFVVFFFKVSLEAFFLEDMHTMKV